MSLHGSRTVQADLPVFFLSHVDKIPVGRIKDPGASAQKIILRISRHLTDAFVDLGQNTVRHNADTGRCGPENALETFFAVFQCLLRFFAIGDVPAYPENTGRPSIFAGQQPNRVPGPDNRTVFTGLLNLKFNRLPASGIIGFNSFHGFSEESRHFFQRIGRDPVGQRLIFDFFGPVSPLLVNGRADIGIVKVHIHDPNHIRKIFHDHLKELVVFLIFRVGHLQ